MTSPKQLRLLSLALLLLTSFATGEEPKLKHGVRLTLGNSRAIGWSAPDVIDWNNDGLNDVVIGRFSGELAVFLNRGAGKAGIEFEQVDLHRDDGFGTGGKPTWAWRFNKANCVCPGPGRLSPRVVDWDNDGKKDLVIGDGRGAQTRVWKNIGTDSAPVYSTHHITYLPPDGGIRPYHETVQPFIVDWNGDGKKDLIMGRNRGVYVYLNEGTDDAPTFDFERSRLGTKIRDVFPVQRLSPVFADWDGDGLKDLIVGSQRGEVWFARNSGSQTTPEFDSYTSIQAGGKDIHVGTEARIAVADLDGDGRADLVVGGGSGLVWFYQAENPNPAPARVPVKRAPPLAAPAETATRPAIPAVDPKVQPPETDDMPVIGITYKSPVVEPATAGVLTLTRTGNTRRAVSVKLTARRGHNPVVADVDYVPLPPSVRLKAGQNTVDVRVKPIDDTLVHGPRTLSFQIAPSTEYQIETKHSAASMKFLDDDCPNVSITMTNGATGHTFKVTAEPAPRRDTTVTYSVSGTAIGGVHYQALPAKVTIPAGETSATIPVTPFRQKKGAEKKTVTLTLPLQPFTYFEFYHYLTQGRPRTASLFLTPSASAPEPPDPGQKPAVSLETPEVAKLRGEIASLGWIVFTARSDGPDSDLDLLVMRPDGSQLRNLTRTPQFDEHSARVSPDGKRMLYRRTAKTSRPPINMRLPQDVGNVALRTWPSSGTLVIANSDGSEPRPVGSNQDYAWATWGPDGRQIACLEVVEATAASSALPVGKTDKKAGARRIVIRDAKTLEVVKSLPSAGIQRELVWSPDGTRICGPADIRPGEARSGKGIEYPLGIGKMVSVDINSGKRTAMARFPDWYPVWATDGTGDWFQGGAPEILHSANNYGICPAYYSMLWRSGLQHQPSQLVYGEFHKHIFGGCTSPDDQYAVFVIGSETWPLLGNMAVIRLADAPLARGRSNLFHEVLADYFPGLKSGPVLDLTDVPEGFEPHWTMAEIGTP